MSLEFSQQPYLRRIQNYRKIPWYQDSMCHSDLVSHQIYIKLPKKEEFPDVKICYLTQIQLVFKRISNNGGNWKQHVRIMEKNRLRRQDYIIQA
jgi:hypothetical protein